MICTSIEQSKRLLELGLDPKTADMSYSEEWKDIEGFDGIYKISSYGRVLSLHGKSPHLLKQGQNHKGYKIVSLQKDCKHKTCAVHRLVAKAFIPNPNDYPCVNHKDESRDNNHVDNLEWCTVAYNNTYGTIRYRQSLASPKSREVCMFDLRGNLERTFRCVRDAARQLKCKHSVICHCCEGFYNGQRRLTYKNKLWCYKGDEHIIPQRVEELNANRHHHIVLVTMPNGEKLTFNSATQAGKELKLSRNRFNKSGSVPERNISWIIS